MPSGQSLKRAIQAIGCAKISERNPRDCHERWPGNVYQWCQACVHSNDAAEAIDKAVAEENDGCAKFVQGKLHDAANWSGDYQIAQYPELAQLADEIYSGLMARAEPSGKGGEGGAE